MLSGVCWFIVAGAVKVLPTMFFFSTVRCVFEKFILLDIRGWVLGAELWFIQHTYLHLDSSDN